MTDAQLQQQQVVAQQDGDQRSKLWPEFLKSQCRKSIAEIQREYPHTRALYIDYRALERWGPDGLMLADEVLVNPGKMVEEIYDAIIVNNLIKPKKDRLTSLHVRFINLPRKIRVRDIRAVHVNTFITVEGMITRVSEVRPRLTEAAFKCPAGHFTQIGLRFGKFIEPSECSTAGCRYKKLDLVPKRSKYQDSQTGRIQENTDGLQPGEQPQYLAFDMEDDLVGRMVPGERVILNGILRSHQKIVRGEKSTVFDLFLEVNSIERDQRNYGEIEITEEEEKEILRLAKTPDILTTIAQSILPAISGLDEEKKGIVLHLFSAHQETFSGKNLRGSIHLMLGGDPGISKTTLMMMLQEFTPRAVYISGKSTTAAGLTFTMRQDEYDKRWVADAGAAAMADGSNLFVDELAQMEKGDIMALNEFMENQVLVVTKAGLHAILQARCAVMVALNPKMGRFDMAAPLADQIDQKIPPQLLSRFDLIYLIPDVPSEDRDRKEANDIIGLWCGESPVRENQIPLPLLQKYIALAKRRKNPKINAASKREIVERFVSIRKGSNGNNITVTKRMLETLARLATAHAILRFGDEVTLHDAEVAIKVLEHSLKQVSYDLQTGRYNADKISGMTQSKRNMIGVIKEIVGAEPGLSLELLAAKMAERSYTDPLAIKTAIDQMVRGGELLEPKHERYRLL